MKLSVKGMKNSEKFWRVVTNLSLIYNVFCYFMSVLNRVYRPFPPVKIPLRASVVKMNLMVAAPQVLWR